MTVLDPHLPPDNHGAAGTLGTWGAAWRSGACAPDDVLDTLREWGAGLVLAADAHAAQQFSLAPAGETTGALLPVLRTATRLTLLLPTAGAPVGLPPANSLTTAALEAGEVLLLHSDDGESDLALVPRHDGPATLTWYLHTVEFNSTAIESSHATASVREVEHRLREATRGAAELLDGIGGAGGRLDDPRARLSDIQQHAARLAPPPGSDPRSSQVLDTATRIESILRLTTESGAAFGVSATHHNGGDEALRDLGRTVREARMIAINSIIRGYLNPR